MANERILIVEDESPVATLLERYLKKAGFSISAKAETGEEALRQAESLYPDLVLMDIEIKGGIDGVETAQRLHDRFDIPVVFLTGLADEATLDRVRQSDSFGYLLKPFRPGELKASIELAFKKHKGERKLKEIEQWFSAAIKAIGDAVITTDKAGRVTFVNPVAEALIGWSQHQAVGSSLSDVFHVIDGPVRAAGENPVTRVVRKGMTAGFPRETVLLAKDGREAPIETNVSPIKNDQGHIIGSVLIFRDIAERKQAERELNRSREQFRSLVAHLQSVREEERTRIAREVHDELGQLITGLKMDLAWLEKKLPQERKVTPGSHLLEKTQSMSALLNQMVQSVRKISAELRPGVLDNLGLVAALEWQAREFETHTGIPCKITTDLEEADFDADLSTAVFRIFQESLTNVARHAKATSVAVSFKECSGQLLLEVTDDGCGISDSALRKSSSFGVLGMRERAAILGGEFWINGKAGAGTVVTVKLPHGGTIKQVQPP
ncbi:MAG: response regulator [Verrucomicrobia bacterium]|nr:response regulator [Verrucomicrobiota bacterium]